jgi:hypothetical protein
MKGYGADRVMDLGISERIVLKPDQQVRLKLEKTIKNRGPLYLSGMKNKGVKNNYKGKSFISRRN